MKQNKKTHFLSFVSWKYKFQSMSYISKVGWFDHTWSSPKVFEQEVWLSPEFKPGERNSQNRNIPIEIPIALCQSALARFVRSYSAAGEDFKPNGSCGFHLYCLTLEPSDSDLANLNLILPDMLNVHQIWKSNKAEKLMVDLEYRSDQKGGSSVGVKAG